MDFSSSSFAGDTSSGCSSTVNPGEIGLDRVGYGRVGSDSEATGSDMVTTVAGVYDILFGMRRCMINLPDRCQRLIGRVAHRAFEGGKRRIERVAPL